MKLAKKITLAFPGLVMILSLVAIPVQAHGDTSTSGSSTTETSAMKKTDDFTTVPKTDTHTEAEKEIATQNAQHAKAELNKIEKTGRKKHTEDQRKKTCQGLQHGLETKLANLGKNAQKHQANIDAVLTKAEAYHAEHKVIGSDDLITQAKTAQAASQATVDALQTMSVKIDCNDPNIAQTVATFKAAAASAHDQLQAYRKSVKAVLASFEQTKQEESDQ